MVCNILHNKYPMAVAARSQNRDEDVVIDLTSDLCTATAWLPGGAVKYVKAERIMISEETPTLWWLKQNCRYANAGPTALRRFMVATA